MVGAHHLKANTLLLPDEGLGEAAQSLHIHPTTTFTQMTKHGIGVSHENMLPVCAAKGYQLTHWLSGKQHGRRLSRVSVHCIAQ